MAEDNYMSPITDELDSELERKLQIPRMQLTSKINMSIESHSQSNSQFDREELLNMQIKQLRKQNNFLKKKLNDLTRQIEENGGHTFTKWNKNKKIQKRATMNLDEKPESLKFSVQLFYKQITTLIQTVSHQFKNSNKKIDQKEDQIVLKENSFTQDENKKPNVMKKEILNKKLQKIALDKEENRYHLLLELFIQYYRTKAESQRQLLKLVDTMTEKTIEMSRRFLERGQLKKSLRSSTISSNILDFGENYPTEGFNTHHYFDKIQKIDELSEDMFASHQFPKRL